MAVLYLPCRLHFCLDFAININSHIYNTCTCHLGSQLLPLGIKNFIYSQFDMLQRSSTTSKQYFVNNIFVANMFCLFVRTFCDNNNIFARTLLGQKRFFLLKVYCGPVVDTTVWGERIIFKNFLLFCVVSVCRSAS